MSLCRRRPAGRRCAPSASCVSTCIWTRAPPRGRCIDQSNTGSTTGGPMLCGPNWTEGLPSRSTRGPKSAATPPYVFYVYVTNLQEVPTPRWAANFLCGHSPVYICRLLSSFSLIGQCVVIGAGPCGLRTAVELSFMGARVVLLEKRDSFSRNNVLHLWPFTIHDLRGLGAKKFYGKFCAGSIDHISECEPVPFLFWCFSKREDKVEKLAEAFEPLKVL